MAAIPATVFPIPAGPAWRLRVGVPRVEPTKAPSLQRAGVSILMGGFSLRD